jgi:hypothetical protein
VAPLAGLLAGRAAVSGVLAALLVPLLGDRLVRLHLCPCPDGLHLGRRERIRAGLLGRCCLILASLVMPAHHRPPLAPRALVLSFVDPAARVATTRHSEHVTRAPRPVSLRATNNPHNVWT